MTAESFLKEGVFVTIDGRELKVKDHFKAEDIQSEKGGGIFIKHNVLLRTLKQLFTIREYIAYPIQVAEKNNDWCCTAEVKYVVAPKLEKGVGGVVESYSWQSIADCNRHNAYEKFENFTTTMAETRASVRALRFILGIDVCGSEELTSTDDVLDSEDENKAIIDTQLSVLTHKFFGEHGFKMADVNRVLKTKYDDLQELSYNEAKTLIQKFNKTKPKAKKQAIKE